MLVYNIREQKVQATSRRQRSQRVHITITPQTQPKQGAPPAGKAASPSRDAASPDDP